eukprot:2690109-Prymnesium_polylepis.1
MQPRDVVGHVGAVDLCARFVCGAAVDAGLPLLLLRVEHPFVEVDQAVAIEVHLAHHRIPHNLRRHFGASVLLLEQRAELRQGESAVDVRVGHAEHDEHPAHLRLRHVDDRIAMLARQAVRQAELGVPVVVREHALAQLRRPQPPRRRRLRRAAVDVRRLRLRPP